MTEHTNEPKRRKVRKGTQSCWECRRRKVRCIFSIPAKLVCDNCTRRRTPCVSQEVCESPASTVLDGTEQSSTRLICIESLVERSSSDAATVEFRHGSGATSSDEMGRSDARKGTVRRVSSTHSALELDTDASDTSLARSHSDLLTSPNSSNNSEHQKPNSSSSNVFKEVNRCLFAAMPSQQELHLICTLPVGLSSHLHCGVCRSYSGYVGQDLPSPADMFRLPSLTSHPVLVARKLLMLGTFLQGAVPSSVQALEARGFYARQVMHRVVDTAIRFVTTKDELIGSVEAIECIMLEAFYHNYAGNLHRAWMATRRAISVAQLMALHRGFESPSIRVLEPVTRATFDLDHVVFRLAEMDAYLSIMLGLHRTSLETRHITRRKVLEACEPTERMQRIHFIVQERLLQRGDFDDLTETHEIDKLLQSATAEMPPQWWLPPTLEPQESDRMKIMHEMVRTMDQFTHYHLLTRLHLPYMLRTAPDRRYDYSKATAVNASREVLTRFLGFHRSNPAHYYCRGSDFLAFIAATVLSIAHINRHSNACDEVTRAVDAGTAFDFLAHSRPSDRGLMERVLEVIEAKHGPGTDAIASKISRLLGDLLAVEASAANGTNYSTTPADPRSEELDCDGQMSDGGKVLRLHIPHIGSIQFERGAISRTLVAATKEILSSSTTAASAFRHSPDLSGLDAETSALPGMQDQNAAASDLLATPNHIHHGPSSVESDTTLDHAALGQSFDDFWWPATDDWDLQGVDVALFDTLFSEPRTADFPEEGWMS